MLKNKSGILKTLIITVILFNLFSFASAFGVGSPYNQDSPLSIPPGEVKNTYFLMQNMVSNSSVVLKAAITQGNEIAQIIDENKTYTVNPGEKDKKANVRISIPENAKHGDSYTVVLTLSQASVADGSVGLMLLLESKIYVVVGDWIDESGDLNIPLPEPPLSPWVQEKNRAEILNKFALGFIIAIVIVLALILFFSLRSRRDKNNLQIPKRK